MDTSTPRVRCVCVAALLGFVLLGVSVPARADLVTLGDLNSNPVVVDTDSQDGLKDWTVDGIDHMAKQWLWYRVGNNAEQSVDNLTINAGHLKVLDSNWNLGNDRLLVRYTGVGFTITIDYVLTGGEPGSGASDLVEVIKVDNTSGAALDFHLFQYVDFDLNGDGSNDTAEILGGNTAHQTSGLTTAEVVATRGPDQYAVALVGGANDILTSLNDANPTDLGTANTGPLTGNVSWAFQWDVTIADGGSFIISKNKNIHVVPEPATVGLLAFGSIALGAAGLRRRRRR